MKYIARFGMFWYDFLIGDCWQIAAGVVVALAVAIGHEQEIVHLYCLGIGGPSGRQVLGIDDVANGAMRKDAIPYPYSVALWTVDRIEFLRENELVDHGTLPSVGEENRACAALRTLPKGGGMSRPQTMAWLMLALQVWL